MKGKIRIILDELRDIERTEGLGAITEGKINEICKAQGVSFDEFKSSVLKILAEEAGISLDELNSFLLEEIGELEKISELDLDKISGGASVSDAVKRGAASLMAILNLSGMSNSYAGMPNSAKVRRDNGAVISKSKVVLSKEEIAEKWVKRLGASAAGITLTLLAVIGLNNLKNKENNASGDKAETISVAELNKMNWKRLSGGEAREIAPEIFTSEDNKLSLKSKFYVHMSEGKDKYKGALMYVVGYIKPHDGSKPSILISDDIKCLREHKNSGTVQIFENGLINDSDERVENVIWGLKQSYIFNNSINLSRGKKVTNDIPKWVNVYKSDDTDFTVLSGNDIATKLSEYKQYYVYLTDHYNPTSALRIVGVSEDNRSLLISDDYSCDFNNLANNLVLYNNPHDLVEDGIIARLRLAYRSVKSIDRENTSSESSINSDGMANSDFGSNSSGGSSSWEPDESILDEAKRIYEYEYNNDNIIKLSNGFSKINNGQIVDLQKKRLALQLSSPTLTFKEAEAAMDDIKKELHELKKESKYFNETQKQNWQCKFASTVCPEFSEVFETFGFSKEFDNLALGIISTEHMDNYHIDPYTDGLTDDSWKYQINPKPSGRTNSRYNRLFRDQGVWRVLKPTYKDVMDNRGAMSLNLTLKTSTRNGKGKSSKQLLKTIVDNKEIIQNLAEEIKNMNAYHQCSDIVFGKILNEKAVLSMDRLRSPFIGKTDQEKLRYIWESLSSTTCSEKPNQEFEQLIKNYDKTGVAEFLKTCVGGEKLDDIMTKKSTELCLSGIPEGQLRRGAQFFENKSGASSKISRGLEECAEKVQDYMKKVDSSSLINRYANGLAAKKDARAGTTTTIFSILGGNKEAINEYALKGGTSNKGCIIEIPNRCVSYASPYALLLDADPYAIAAKIRQNRNQGSDDICAVQKNEFVKEGIDFTFGKNNTTSGLIAFADHPYIDDLWVSDTGFEKIGKYSNGNNLYNPERQISQLLRSRKLDPSNDMCAKALAIYMFCQYMILNNGRVPTSVDEVLETSYQMVGSHACMEGHSPGEIPLGGGGIERVLMIGYDETNAEDKKVIEKARKQKMKVNCIKIKEVPQTRAEFIAAFEGCT